MKQIAVHEAGHVTVAKAFGYSTEYMRIVRDTRDAVSKILWDEDEIFINTFLIPEQYGLIFNRLPLERRAQTFQMAGRYIMILCSGSAAEAYYNNKEDVDNGIIQYIPIEMGAGDLLLRHDLDKIEKTEAFVRPLGHGTPLGSRENQLRTMFKIIKGEEFFNAIDSLSDLLINSESLSINQAEIEDCLNDFNLVIGR